MTQKIAQNSVKEGFWFRLWTARKTGQNVWNSHFQAAASRACDLKEGPAEPSPHSARFPSEGFSYRSPAHTDRRALRTAAILQGWCDLPRTDSRSLENPRQRKCKEKSPETHWIQTPDPRHRQKNSHRELTYHIQETNDISPGVVKSERRGISLEMIGPSKWFCE